MESQSGIVARRQAVAAGLTPADVQRLVRRREWHVVHAGVYAARAGPWTWHERAWAAVLHAGPDALLCGESALRAARGAHARGHLADDAVVHVAVPRPRTVVAPPGVRVHRPRRLEGRVLWRATPPRLRHEEAVVDLALTDANPVDAIGRLAEAVAGRPAVSVRRLQAAIDRRRASPRSRWLSNVLVDVAAGACSTLEHEYLTQVVRRHGLPEGVMQARGKTSGRTCFRDVDHPHLSLVVELDGRLHHGTTAQRDRDLRRDLEAAADDERRTVRLGWGQVHRAPCDTAALLARLMGRSGWDGRARPCGPRCSVA
ncbi:MAG TPA: hypothetical protein VGE77_05010 [Nocardioides sp.]